MNPRSLLSTLPAPTSRFQPWTLWSRLGLATAMALVAAAQWRMHQGSVPGALWIPTGLLVASAVLLHIGHVGSQLMARSVWWASLVLGTVLSLVSDGTELDAGRILAMSTGIALLAMGRLGLDGADGGGFRPVAFRTTLTLGMVMAVADAQALALFAALKLQPGGWKERAAESLPQAAMLAVSAALLVAAIAGLYRLRVWGLLLAALGAAGVCVLSVTNEYGLPIPLATGMALTSAAQVLLPVPVFVAILRGRPVAPAASPSRLARLGPGALVVAMMTACVARMILNRG
jgi:hypothetical protein